MINKKTKLPMIKLYSAEPPEPVSTQETTIAFECWKCGCRNKLSVLLTWNGAMPHLPKDEVNKTK